MKSLNEELQEIKNAKGTKTMKKKATIHAKLTASYILLLAVRGLLCIIRVT